MGRAGDRGGGGERGCEARTLRLEAVYKFRRLSRNFDLIRTNAPPNLVNKGEISDNVQFPNAVSRWRKNPQICSFGQWHLQGRQWQRENQHRRRPEEIRRKRIWESADLILRGLLGVIKMSLKHSEDV